jgi:hypothetical protein
LTIERRIMEFFSSVALAGVLFFTLNLAGARAAQLVMFTQAGCVYCENFDRQIGTIYDNTEDGLRAPLRRVDIDRPLPPDLSFIHVERLTPLFVLVDKGREIGRIRGYGGREMFWTQLYALMQKLDQYSPQMDRARLNVKPSSACG